LEGGELLTCLDARGIAIVRAIGPRLNAYLRQAVRRDVERDLLVVDIMDDVCLEIENEPTPESAWLRAIIVMRRLVAKRRQWRRHEVEFVAIAHLPAIVGLEAKQAYRLALWQWEEAALEHLTTLQRGALELYAMDDLSDDKIALMLGSSRASVRVLRHGAKLRLRNLVESGAIAPPPTDCE
jgi:DNA-directed RNA polymerase specialized sigma24 family protein